MLDAYAVRKAIPRVVLAVIAINLSIYLCVAALDITMVVGRGLNQLLVTPFIDQNSFNGVGIESNVENNILGVLGVGGLLAGAFAALLGAAGVIGAAAVALLGLMLPLVVTIAFIAMAVLFTLVIRQGLLVFLTVISPVAIVCYVLPGTEKYFRQWWDLFLKTLMVYPIIAVIFAMANVLGAILLNSASGANPGSMVDNFRVMAATTPDAIGTVQIIAAILVLYAPLVLIPFAFKIAGGAISTIANMASGRAASMSGRINQGIQKSRQDPNSWLGSRALRAKQNRIERGVTPGQIVPSTLAGIGARARGRSFRSAYQASSGTLGRTKAFDAASAFMENNADFKAIAGNDDSLWAFRHGNNMEEVRQILQDRGYRGTDLDETAAMVMRAKNEAGSQVGAIAAVRAQAKTGTGYEDNAMMLQDIISATGGDMGTAGRMLAEMRGSAAQSGRMELGTSSFNTQMLAMGGIREAMATGNPGQIGAALQDANHEVMRSVIDSNTGGAAVHGKPASAQAFARAHREKITDLLDSLSTGRVTNVNGEQRVANSRDVKQAIAAAHGVHDAMRSASPQNARAFADELMGAGLNTHALSPEARAALGPAWSMEGVGETSLGPEQNLTIRQVMDGMAGRDQEYTEMRQDFAIQSQADAARAQRQEQQLAIARQQEQHPNTPPPTPGGMPQN